MIENLEMMGLTKNEINVYRAILESGQCSGTEIRRKAGIANSQVYAALDTLLQKGMIAYERHSSGKIYSALDPAVLKELAQERMNKITESIPFLESIKKTGKKPSDTAVFEGYSGFKAALYKMTQDCPKGEIVDVIGFSNQSYKSKRLVNIMRDVNKLARKKNHKLRVIFDNKQNAYVEERRKDKMFEMRFMGRGFKSPAALNIYQDTVYFLIWEETPYAFMIKNRKVTEGFKVYFEFLWKMAKP
jgi:sugar-specific transcriptional regulator TrmB